MREVKWVLFDKARSAGCMRMSTALARHRLSEQLSVRVSIRASVLSCACACVHPSVHAHVHLRMRVHPHPPAQVHYMRDKERGVVWEEVMILLPRSVKYVMLSATVPNALEFASWIANLHQQPCHVVYTGYRPTPLMHYIFPQGGQGMYLVVDDKATFKSDQFTKVGARLHTRTCQPHAHAHARTRPGTRPPTLTPTPTPARTPHAHRRARAHAAHRRSAPSSHARRHATPTAATATGAAAVSGAARVGVAKAAAARVTGHRTVSSWCSSSSPKGICRVHVHSAWACACHVQLIVSKGYMPCTCP